MGRSGDHARAGLPGAGQCHAIRHGDADVAARAEASGGAGDLRPAQDRQAAGPNGHRSARPGSVRSAEGDRYPMSACHRVRSRLVSRRTATINQIRAFLIEQGIAVRAGPRALRNSLFAVLENRKDEISPRTAGLILGL